MKLNFRTIRNEDIDQVYALEKECFSAPWPRSAFEEIVDKKDADYFLAEDEETGKIVGGMVLFYIMDEGDIMNVSVTESYRGRGIATSLLKYVLEAGEKRGIIDFTLEVRVSNAPAIRVYEKNGFVSEGIRPGFYTKPREDANVMWRRHKGGKC